MSPRDARSGGPPEETTVPVLVVVDDGGKTQPGQQRHKNERRKALTETDWLAAREQLTIVGVPVGTIARRLGCPNSRHPMEGLPS